MTQTEIDPIPAFADGPKDLEFFFDPGCPFAWQTSVWIRRVAELRDLTVGWRFISLKMINENNDLPEPMVDAQDRTLRYLRLCAAAREQFGNDTVAELYRAWGERYWYTATSGDLMERLAGAAERIDPAEILQSLDLPSELLAAADDDSWDTLIRAESDEAFRRTGPDVGTPIVTYGASEGSTGASFFGPVISDVADDETALAIYDAVVTLSGHPGFSELKRSKRPNLDLPLFAEG